MLPRETAGRLDIAGFDGIDDLGMSLGVGRSLRDARRVSTSGHLRDPALLVGRPQRLERPDEQQDRGVPTEACEQLMEPARVLCRGIQIVDVAQRGLVSFTQQRDDSLRSICPTRAELDTRRLEMFESHSNVQERDSFGLQHEGRVVGDSARPRRADSDTSNAAAENGHEALRLEHLKGAAQRGGAHAELDQQILLTRKQLAIGELAVEDPLAKLVGDHISKPGLAVCRQCPALAVVCTGATSRSHSADGPLASGPTSVDGQDLTSAVGRVRRRQVEQGAIKLALFAISTHGAVAAHVGRAALIADQL